MEVLKLEMKQLKQERDKYHKSYLQCITLQDGNKTEIINMLSQSIETLIREVSLNAKIKEIFRRILMMLNYSNTEIDNVFLNRKKTRK